MNNQIFSPWGEESVMNVGEHMYKVTGVTVHGKRFKIETSDRIHALGINLWRGSVWESTSENKWRLINRVYNP